MFVATLVLALTGAPAQAPGAKEKPVRRPAVLRPVRPLVPAGPIVVGGPVAIAIPPLVPPMPGASGTAPAMLSVGGPGDEAVLKAARLGTTDDALVDFFRKRTPPAPARERIATLVKQLGAKELTDRDVAQAELTAIGQAAIPLLRTAANNVDEIEASTRARQCLLNIEGTTGAGIVVNAARLLGARKPAAAGEVLIAYLPFAEDDLTFQEVEAALVLVAVREGKPDSALVKALQDKLAIRRGTAAQVLCQAGGAATHKLIRPLLKDERASVRMRAALGLVGAFDSEAIPVLIELLGDVTPRHRQEAEDYLTQLAGEWAVTGPKGNDQMSRRLRREVWLTWWKSADGEKLLEEFRGRTASDEERERVAGLIAKLADEKAETRDAAMNDLIGLGKPAASLLRRAINDNHPRISPLAARCLDSIEKDAPPALPGAASRLLGLRKPEGTVETLLGYLPFAESAEAADQIVDILAAVGCVAGKPDAALVKALENKVAARRAGAVLALSRGKVVTQVAAIRKLLEDPDQTVKLRAAQGLSMLGDREAIPALIALLKDLPLDQVWDVEDYLNRVAGDTTPTEVVTSDPASRTRAIDAWTKWWKENGKTTDLARLDPTRRDMGFHLVLEKWNPALGRGRILEIDAAGKVRWEVRDLQFPDDVQLLRGGNILVVEQQNRVTERDRSGKVVGLDRYFPSVFHVERLRDGTTFVACRHQLQIIDSKGTAQFTHSYTANQILAARRFRDGSIAYVAWNGYYVKLDRTGKQIKTMNLNWWNTSPIGAEILPGDRVVLADQRFNKVIEFDGDGKKVWECAVSVPLPPHVMTNGHVLVAGNNNNAIYEIDRKGKIVKEWKGFAYKPHKVYRR